MYLGIDTGSVSVNVALIDSKNKVIAAVYARTHGDPINAIKNALREIKNQINKEIYIEGVGTTGSAKELAAVLVGADIVKNEITCQAIAALNEQPDVRTVIEIGGQDSKIILMKNKHVIDFNMNTVCAAGTGSFLDQQSSRLGIDVEEFGPISLNSKNSITIAGRCTVFAESDMIHKQQLGYSKADILRGLCDSLVRNYINNVGKGKEIHEPILFQGGVASNIGIKKAFERELNKKIIIPKHFKVMGAIGAAILSKKTQNTNFKGFNIIDIEYKTESFECKDCPNNCEVIQILNESKIIGTFGDKCEKYQKRK